MFVAKPAHKAATMSDDFMFVVIEANQGEETRLFVIADDSPRRLLALQSLRESNGASLARHFPPSKGVDVRSEFGRGATRT